MKQLLVYLLVFSLFACHKEAPPSQPSATLTVVNTVVQGQPVKLASHMQTINNNLFAHLGFEPGDRDIYVFPANDSLYPYYTQSKFAASAYEIHTLLLCGTAVNPDAILLKEAIPYRTDSTFGVRFINLAPGSPALKVTLSTSVTTAEFDDINYKKVSTFKSYAATAAAPSYTFQIRRADDETLISSLAISGTNLAAGLPRFKNITLILRGIVGGSPAAGITRVNHY